MFSQTVEYALRAVVHLSLNCEAPQRTASIAESTKVPLAYLSKILQGLQREKIVHLQRGIGGGVKLAHSPDALTILDVVNAVEPVKRIHTCPMNLASHGKNLCELHRRLDDSMSDIEQALAATKLSQLMHDTNLSPALCEV
jgi:Rrf2 family transcriptional regulator, nitric oxide-sensitive transcriptional repressor